MTHSLSRLIAFPFAIILIFAFSYGGFDFTGPKTIAVLFSLIALTLIYVFNAQINIWWWKRRPPPLDKALRSWVARYSKFYAPLNNEEKEIFETRVSAFNHIKNFTLKVEREYQLEEDVKTIISHEFIRITLGLDEYLYDGIDHFVVYNHAFGSPEIPALHTMELYWEDKVVILSKEQLINGFFQPELYVNTALFMAVKSFIMLYPRLSYPEVVSLTPGDIADAHGIVLEVIIAALGVSWVNRLDLLVFCYWLYPDRTASFDPDRYEQLAQIFNRFDLSESTTG